MEDIDGWNKAFFEFFVTTIGFIWRGYFASKYDEYCIRRIAGLKLGSQRMCGDIFSCLLLVGAESSVESGIKIRARGRWGGNIRHYGSR